MIPLPSEMIEDKLAHVIALRWAVLTERGHVPLTRETVRTMLDTIQALKDFAIACEATHAMVACQNHWVRWKGIERQLGVTP